MRFMDKYIFLSIVFCVPQKKTTYKIIKNLNHWNDMRGHNFLCSTVLIMVTHFVSSSVKCEIYKKIIFVFINLQSHTGTQANALNCFKEYFPKFNSTSYSTEIFQLNVNVIFKICGYALTSHAY